MSDLIKKLEAFRVNLVGEDMNYRACLVDEGISHIRELEAALQLRCPQCDMRLAERTALETESKLPLGCHRSHPHEDMDAGCQRLTEIAREANEQANKGQEARCWECGMTTAKAHYDDCPLAETPAPDHDPTPWCSGCNAMRKADCKCGPIAENE